MKPEPTLKPSRPAESRRLLANLPVWVFPLGALAGIGVMAGLWFAFQAILEAVSFKTIGINYELLKAYVAANTGQAALMYVAAYAMLGALILPGSALLVVASGLFFGAGVGVPLSLFSSMLAAMLAFWLVRTALGQRLAALPSPAFAKFRAGFARHGLGYMLFLRLTPGLPFGALNVVPSLIGVSVSTFAVGTFLGLLPSRIVLSTAGAGLGQAIQTQNALYSQCLEQQAADAEACDYDLDVGSLLTNEMLAAFVALAILALIPAILDAAPRVWQRIRTGIKP
jgi:uncharacterized membrane protein YdjX (TVP38/TMEM64 family)